jgi:hypothetical protein
MEFEKTTFAAHRLVNIYLNGTVLFPPEISLDTPFN